MTICSKMLDAVEKKLIAGETEEKISSELCDAVKHPERKLKYTIKLLAKERGLKYKDLVKKYPNSGLQPQKARKTKPEKKDKGSSSKKLSDTKIPNVYINDKTLEKLDEIKVEFDEYHPRKEGKPHTYSSTIRKLITIYLRLKREHPEIGVFEGVASEETPEGNVPTDDNDPEDVD